VKSDSQGRRFAFSFECLSGDDLAANCERKAEAIQPEPGADLRRTRIARLPYPENRYAQPTVICHMGSYCFEDVMRLLRGLSTYSTQNKVVQPKTSVRSRDCTPEASATLLPKLKLSPAALCR